VGENEQAGPGDPGKHPVQRHGRAGGEDGDDALVALPTGQPLQRRAGSELDGNAPAAGQPVNLTHAPSCRVLPAQTDAPFEGPAGVEGFENRVNTAEDFGRLVVLGVDRRSPCGVPLRPSARSSMPFLRPPPLRLDAVSPSLPPGVPRTTSSPPGGWP